VAVPKNDHLNGLAGWWLVSWHLSSNHPHPRSLQYSRLQYVGGGAGCMVWGFSEHSYRKTRACTAMQIIINTPHPEILFFIAARRHVVVAVAREARAP